MPSECIAIKTGYQIENKPKPPNGLSIQLLFSVSSINNKVWIFCCENLNELKQWQSSLEEARLSILMKTGYSNANSLLFNQSLARNPNAMNPLITNPLVHPQFNPMFLSQLPPGYHLSATSQTGNHLSNNPASFNPNLQPIYPMIPFINGMNSYVSPNIPQHHSSNQLFLSTGALPNQLAATYHPQQQTHLSSTQHNSNALNQTNSNHSLSLANTNAINGQLQFSRQSILPTTAIQPNLSTIYNRTDLGLLPNHPTNYLWTTTPNSVWW